MKRSEMIQKMIESYSLVEENHTIYAKMEFVLLTLEEAGMLPPTIEVPAFGVKDNMWEPEND